MSKMNALEKKSAIAIAFMIALRMYGLFLILPVFSVYAVDIDGATPLLVGLAIGVYGLTQALLQIPMGFLSDVWGRKKVIALGLCLFALGSVVAALADDIFWIIVGRLIQGMGAIAATGLALVADVSRPEQRGKMMAIVGSSIGLSFMLAFISGPILAAQFGLSGLFWFTASLAVAALLVLIFVVEEPEKLAARDYSFKELLHCIKLKPLMMMDFGVFALHASMTALFLVLPLVLVQNFNFELAHHWRLYLPVLVLSIGIMVPLIIAQEKLKNHMQMMSAAFLLLSGSLMLLNLVHANFWLLAVYLVAYFGLFNYLEASMPSVISKIAAEKYRGAAMGVFATSEFIGAFVGGALGGYLLSLNRDYVLSAAAGLLLVAALFGFKLFGLKRVSN
ncbi:MFS transporter [Marinicella sp. S1101]|uniref:MFS transporter n=1 Tax=Marinicella marina TaxID=2996016 RepID=UPI002260C69E|nr:MFS transporter [Marinicella marina]MCX7554656.1 MFS transporter [Marinicella marina]MDJ1140721.1 MFS transporter [Marinicella marina]